MKGSQIKWMCHLVKWRGQKIVKSREAWESLTFIRTPPLSPSLPFLAILANIFFRYSFVQFASCEFSGRRYNDCMSGDWGGRGDGGVYCR